ncbi:MAG: hypothetical protein GQF41_3660 [Candidatus Rifleibacterium amylolyticum]|nr:MAG: hypothetical protein GQF41_3660 [Candidatus Rifleibacterium amylolyticum]
MAAKPALDSLPIAFYNKKRTKKSCNKSLQNKTAGARIKIRVSSR